MLYKIAPPYTERYVRWFERSSSQLMARVLLDCTKIKKNVSEDLRTNAKTFRAVLSSLCFARFIGFKAYGCLRVFAIASGFSSSIG